MNPVAPQRLWFAQRSYDRLTHYLFRYPAKFHPPVARALLERYTRPGECVLDPFCGSGTLLVEASVIGRHSVGSDVDPLAAFVSDVKTRRYDPGCLSAYIQRVIQRLPKCRRSDDEYTRRQFCDLSEEEFEDCTESEALWVPDIPNLLHWFRRYVVIDLARILREIEELEAEDAHQDYARLCFGSIIRGVSNADPVPVSGLEVTAHMRRKDAVGRLINPFQAFERALRSGLGPVCEYRDAVDSSTDVQVLQADATTLTSRDIRPVQAVVTSPPYPSAVDYYRRHKLEMYWLRLVSTRADRLALLQHYIGRPQVAARHPFVAQEEIRGLLARSWEARMREVSGRRANAFKHYVVSMQKALGQVAQLLRSEAVAVLVVGNGRWKGQVIPTTDLIVEAARQWFEPVARLWYPLRNRYMSYPRHNRASIDKEYVLVFRRIA